MPYLRHLIPFAGIKPTASIHPLGAGITSLQTMDTGMIDTPVICTTIAVLQTLHALTAITKRSRGITDLPATGTLTLQTDIRGSWITSIAAIATMKIIAAYISAKAIAAKTAQALTIIGAAGAQLFP